MPRSTSPMPHHEFSHELITGPMQEGAAIGTTTRPRSSWDFWYKYSRRSSLAGPVLVPEAVGGWQMDPALSPSSCRCQLVRPGCTSRGVTSGKTSREADGGANHDLDENRSNHARSPCRWITGRDGRMRSGHRVAPTVPGQAGSDSGWATRA